jgi:hypothetical protein
MQYNMFEEMAKPTGPTPEWIEAYREKTKPKPGFMSIAPAPLLAWCYETVLGGYGADLVIPCMREGGDDYRAVMALHAKLATEAAQ